MDEGRESGAQMVSADIMGPDRAIATAFTVRDAEGEVVFQATDRVDAMLFVGSLMEQ